MTDPKAGREKSLYSVYEHEKVLPIVLPIYKELQQVDFQVHHWEINDWQALEQRAHGPIFEAAGYQWRVLLFPKGNSQHEMMSIYLEVVMDTKGESYTKDWSVCGQFAVVISNPDDPKQFYTNNAHHRFCADEIDWGFTRYHDLKSLQTGKEPYINQTNQTVISVFLRVVKDETGVLWRNLMNYDSRKETGYVGIRNQGATCYMNSLIQSLFFTNIFRKAVYRIPTEKEDPNNSVALALQRCFYSLQHSDDSVGTTELTKSFGWDSLDAFMQHDVQEFSRVLQDNLELKMKGTPVDGAVTHIFMGKMKSYIKCVHVDYESSRVEDFYDIQLNVKGCKNLEDSFRRYVDVETMSGENKYMAEGYGLQDACKGVKFESFPPVLHLQLKRFEYDMQRDTMIKINDHHVFPDNINLNEFCSIPSQDPTDCNYVLHGVLVHSGDIDGGHYFALLKPEKDGKWFKFDDDRVTPVTLREVFEDNYGDDPLRVADLNDDDPKTPVTEDQLRCTSARALKRFTNAYMLVYFQQNKLDEILGPVKDEEIPKHLARSLKDNAKAFREDALNTIMSNNAQPTTKQKHITLKKSEKSLEKKCHIM
ncbi:biquitin carboxyl-terminal hydrolase [Mucor mucedo]|uniref:biquitin carboxyl-terminal hydrolase n=1 Tax=Mucor mucedo TaxID=29922 RepID=UPI00221F09E2|nr:biquitin carboxyl-terminal hydrolase [Mucor mucedo]KAI7896065.1 biquitin carboxyl-terminal hydrolase [Mucor mucedo]